MSIDDNLPRLGDDEEATVSLPDSFLEAISALALKAKENTLAPYVQPSTDLSVIKMDEYEEADIPDKTVAKIEELKSIIQSC